MNDNNDLISEKYLEAAKKTLTDEEALAFAKKLNITSFSLNPRNLKIRVKVSSLSCPLCQGKHIEVDRVRIRAEHHRDSQNMVPKMKCLDCDLWVSLWGVALADHYCI